MHAGQHLLSIQGQEHVVTGQTSSGFSGTLSGIICISLCPNTGPSLCLSKAIQSTTVDRVRYLENVVNSCSQLLWFQWVTWHFSSRRWCIQFYPTVVFGRCSFCHRYRVSDAFWPSSSSSVRHVTIKPPGLALRRRSTGSSAVARGSMRPMGWLRPSIPPPTLPDPRYLSVSQAVLRSEVKDTCLFRWI